MGSTADVVGSFAIYEKLLSYYDSSYGYTFVIYAYLREVFMAK